MNRLRLLVLLAFVLTLFGIAFFNNRKISTVSAARDSDANVMNSPAADERTITPVGTLVMDRTTRQPATGALPMNFVRSPDAGSADGRGRYLIAVCSGFGIQISAGMNRAMQSLMVIDLNARPAPIVIQNVYFQTPQSAHVGAVFSPRMEADGSYPLYVSGGVENKIWIFKFTPGAPYPISPAPLGLPRESEKINAPAIDVSSFDETAPRHKSESRSDRNEKKANVYPTGLAISADGETLFVANNLSDNLGIISHPRERNPTLQTVDLHQSNQREFIYPYAVAALAAANGDQTRKIYVSCWGTGTVAVVDANNSSAKPKFISVGRHPTAMIFNSKRTRLYVANSNGDSVSVIDTATDREIERINVRASEDTRLGSSPEGLALSDDDATLYVANAHSNSIAVVKVSDEPTARRAERTGGQAPPRLFSPSALKGLIPTGRYPAAIALANNTLLVANGKGTGVENSSLIANNSDRFPNAPNERFPTGTGRGAGGGGEYSVAIVSGNISAINVPNERALFDYTQQVMRNNHLIAAASAPLFKNGSPFKHVIYVIRENRTYDQVFGDIEKAGDGTPADGDKSLAIFGAGEAAQVARRRDAKMQPIAQNITPNAHALALRFGLLDRFFVNSEASPDGHNWSTAAFSTDYVDKAFRWNYSGRGRTYDFEGYNRLPTFTPKLTELNETLGGNLSRADAENLADYVRRFIPYLNGARDIAEPDSLYLWDACARAGLSFRNYGEFVTTISQADLDAVNTGRSKTYPDTSPTVKTVPTKKTLEGHHHPTYRNFDLNTPDAMTVESYRAAKEASAHGAVIDPFISQSNADARFRATSRLGEWLAEFRAFVAERDAGRGDSLPALSIMRLPNDHTAGLSARKPTPQFYVAENDYALGLLVEAVSNSSYWKDTVIFVVEDDAQDGPDHVDAHRSPALVISAYNRPGALVHEFHNTVSLIRTMEMLLGLPPMNALDAAASPINIFRAEADLTPYKATLPDVALDNLMTPARARDEDEARWMRRTAEQDLAHADLADARTLNEAIWFSVKRATAQMPLAAHLPLYDALRLGLRSEINEELARTDGSSKAKQRRDESDEDE